MQWRIVTLALVIVAVLATDGCASDSPSTMSQKLAGPAPAALARSAGTSMSAMGSSTATVPVVTGEALVGQRIFLEGMTPTGPVKFAGGSPDVGNGACANCHGKDAGGGDGPMIGWGMLTSNAKMEKMPKFVYTTPDQVVAAFTSGMRPDGTKVSPNMPRYQMTAEQAAAVIAYLKAVK